MCVCMLKRQKVGVSTQNTVHATVCKKPNNCRLKSKCFRKTLRMVFTYQVRNSNRSNDSGNALAHEIGIICLLNSHNIFKNRQKII